VHVLKDSHDPECDLQVAGREGHVQGVAAIAFFLGGRERLAGLEQTLY